MNNGKIEFDEILKMFSKGYADVKSAATNLNDYEVTHFVIKLIELSMMESPSYAFSNVQKF